MRIIHSINEFAKAVKDTYFKLTDRAILELFLEEPPIESYDFKLFRTYHKKARNVFAHYGMVQAYNIELKRLYDEYSTLREEYQTAYQEGKQHTIDVINGKIGVLLLLIQEILRKINTSVKKIKRGVKFLSKLRTIIRDVRFFIRHIIRYHFKNLSGSLDEDESIANKTSGNIFIYQFINNEAFRNNKNFRGHPQFRYTIG